MRIIHLLFLTLMIKTGYAQEKYYSDTVLSRNYTDKIVPRSINSRNDFLYCGMDNLLILSYPDESSRHFNYVVKVNNGTIFEDSLGFFCIPRFAGRAFISVFLLTPERDTLLISKKEFTVQNIPSPYIKIGHTVIKDKSEVDRKVFFAGDSLKVYFSDDIPASENWCTVEFFSIGYTYGPGYISVDNEGALVRKEMIDFLKGLRPGQEVVIQVTKVNSSMIIKQLPLMKFRIR